MTSTATHDAPSSTRTNGVLFLLAISVLINYLDRSNLSIAAPAIKDELGISATQLGVLLSAFFWTYALMQIPAGWLVDRFDVKWVFAAGFFLWSASTAVTSLLHGFVALLIIRVILGLGESVAFPSYGKVLGRLFNEHRRGFANSMIITGLALGPALGIWLGGRAVGRFGWRPFFLVLGLAGLLWLPLWSAWMPARTCVSSNSDGHKAGFLDILRQRSAWGTCIGQAAINYYLYFLVTWLPFYLVRGRNLSQHEMANAGGLLFLVSAASSALSGKLSDRWIRAGASPTLVRKGMMLFGHVGIGILLVLTVLAPARLLTPALAVTGAFLGLSMCNSWAISQMLAGPRMVGRWIGVQNFVGNLAGAVAPALTGFLLDRTGSYDWPFVIAAVVAWIGGVGWWFVIGPLDEVNWAKAHGNPSALTTETAGEAAGEATVPSAEAARS
jgi:MFS transporter, ACS family, D-galactonate transporter